MKTLEQNIVQPGSDTSSDVARAAAHLVAHRDGLFAHLMWLAEQTGDLSADHATVVISRLLYVFGDKESMRRAAQIVTLAEPCWGLFREKGAERIASVELVRAVCLDTATAVRDAMHRDSCVCGVK